MRLSGPFVRKCDSASKLAHEHGAISPSTDAAFERDVSGLGKRRRRRRRNARWHFCTRVQHAAAPVCARARPIITRELTYNPYGYFLRGSFRSRCRTRTCIMARVTISLASWRGLPSARQHVADRSLLNARMIAVLSSFDVEGIFSRKVRDVERDKTRDRTRFPLEIRRKKRKREDTSRFSRKFNCELS